MARHGGSATTDVDADCARLAEAGTPVRGPDEPPWGRMASFTDPDGNGLMPLTEAHQQEGRQDRTRDRRGRDPRAGRQRIHRLEAAPLAEAQDWLQPYERFWRGRLKDLGALLDRPPDDGVT